MVEANEFRILHYARCGTLGGVENLLTPLLEYEPERLAVRHHLLVRSSRIHPHIRQSILRSTASLNFVRSWNCGRIPIWPRQLIGVRIRRITRRIGPDISVIWNCLSDGQLVDTNLRGAPVVYYDHAAAWYAPLGDEQRRLLANVDAAICCSYASQRMLQLRWGFKGPIAVCPNGARTSTAEQDRSARRALSGRTLRLGIAARLEPVKGTSLAIHALAELLREGYICELHIAGTGTEEASLRALCRRLDLEHATIFHGLIADMSTFYRSIDIYLSPSLSEPFGLVCLEAAAHGCPVIAAKVDGIPEVVVDGTTGILLKPSLPAQGYPKLGGKLEQLPAVVYDPLTDSIQAPKLLDPMKIAAAVAALIDDPVRLSRLRINAQAHASKGFTFRDYAERLLTMLHRLAHDAKVMATSQSQMQA